MDNASPYIAPDDSYQRRFQGRSVQEQEPPELIPKNTFEPLAGKLLLFLVILLMCLGVLAVYSSGAGWGVQKFSNSEYFLWRQAFYTFLGITVIFLVGGLNYKILKRFSKIILIAAVGLLGLLLVLKAVGLVDGAARWIGFGKFRFQASDMAKYAIIIYMSHLISEKQSYIKDLHRAYYPMISILMAVVTLVALEPNFSTASVLALIGFIMMFAGRVSLLHLIVTLLAVLPFGAIFAIAAPYRMARLLTFIGQGDAAMSYQIRQALIGFGNGGLFGLGPGESKQRELFLPAPYNDFIFAVVGEEYGFLGAVLILLIFVGIVICGVSIAKNAMDEFGRHLAFGITIAIGLYAFINAGVACHVLPTTGLPMPFISFGGSAALFNSFGVGILISISREKKRLKKSQAKTEKKAEPKTGFGGYAEAQR
ncbi:cell cycle protein [Chloroherpeton thalassium ATCC 35110]|uniref:Probable peptidoglycan glycosyltransferase FtsW n=1 Tax=Chloroherpeton thalassium (strain ATCC 35110 / GB-78) TaxID=517418 RepID=B3QWT6_CHLT3|nr:putative peptidoglycan glycosyltransferase FtsW [Chloroherpeton thalassium]ACF13300.1 cell cycle protein [Chloroherpeton thalassium ATCC 35110]